MKSKKISTSRIFIAGVIVFIGLMLFLAPMNTLAATEVSSGTCGTNVTWSLDDEGTLTISGSGKMEKYSNSSNVPWYSNMSSIKSVVINSGVTYLANYSFYECGGLTSITIPDSITSIGDYVFRGCRGLTSITIPNSVTSIGTGVFTNCTSLTSINVDEGNTYYISQNGVLFNKSMDTLVSFPSGKSGDYVIPDSVISISDHAFYGNKDLTSVIIPDSVTSIGGRAFYDCKGLSSIIIPDSVTSIGQAAFCNCSNLTSLSISNSISSIELWTFQGCTSLTTVIIPDSVTSISSSAFRDCTSLISVTIPASVTNFDNWAFKDCNKLTSINVDENNTAYTSVDGVIFSKSMDTLISYPDAKKGEYVIPDSVTTIKRNAFDACSGLTNVIIPDSVTTIEMQAFVDCTGLTSVIIPDSVSCINVNTFNGCSRLKKVLIPDSVTSISWGGFCACYQLKDIYYTGSESEWSAITIGHSNTPLGSATIHYNTCSSYETHVWPSDWQHDDINHYRYCEFCQEIDSVNHSGGIATCVKGAICEVCNVEYGVTDSNNHSFTNYISDNNATCVADGTKTAKCDHCDATDTIADTGSLDPDNHSFTNYISDNNATCIADGTKTAKCDHCDNTHTIAYTGSLNPDNHNYENGKCTLCGASEPSKIPTPGTGDNTNYVFWVVLLIISGMTATAVVIRHRGKTV